MRQTMSQQVQTQPLRFERHRPANTVPASLSAVDAAHRAKLARLAHMAGQLDAGPLATLLTVCAELLQTAND